MSKCKQLNGRVDILGPKPEDQFALYDKIPVHECTSYRNALTGTWSETPLSSKYFSVENIIYLQKTIQKGVYNMSKGEYGIGEQNCDTLKTIMRGVFLENSANRDDHINEQITSLNQIVINFAVPQIYGNVQSYIKYMRDVSSLAVPMDRPKAPSYNTKTLELKNFF